MEVHSQRETNTNFNTVMSTLSKKGQVTIPSKVRNYIKAEPGDQIQFSMDEKGKIVLDVAKKDSLLSLFGSMPPKGTSNNEDWQKVREQAREEMINKKMQGED